jgi:hypothetical protein
MLFLEADNAVGPLRGNHHMPYLFTRSVRVSGNLVDSMAWAAKITEKVNQIAEIPVALWQPMMSPQINTLNWVSVVEDLAALTATDEKLMADSTYLELVAEGAKFNAGSGVDDQLAQYVHLDRDGAATAQFASIVRAVLAPGAFVAGVTLGVEIAQKAKALSGRPVSFMQSTTGTYGEVAWISLYDTIEQVQAAETAINSDPAFVELLDKKASTAYLPGQATQSLARKVM